MGETDQFDARSSQSFLSKAEVLHRSRITRFSLLVRPICVSHESLLPESSCEMWIQFEGFRERRDLAKNDFPEPGSPTNTNKSPVSRPLPSISIDPGGGSDGS